MNILHLSDIHFNIKFFTKERLEQEISAITKAINDWKDKEEKELDYIFVSGDIVQTGAYNEYEIADAFFSALAANLKLAPNKIFFVPGNHDISWDKISEAEKDYKEQLMSDRINEVELAESKREIYDNQKELLYAKFEFYDKFVSKYSNICSIRDLGNVSNLYKFHYIFKEKGFYIIGLNTVLLSSEYDPDHKFLFVQEQIKEIENSIDEESNILFIMHHSCSYLHRMEKNFFSKFINEQAKTLIFCGHYHDSTNTREGTAIGKWLTECREGAFYATDTPERSFSICHIDFDANKYYFYNFISNRDCIALEWSYKKSDDDYISYPTRDEIERMNASLQLVSQEENSKDKNVLLSFIFGSISTQFASLNDLNSYLESLFLKDKQEFIKIAEKTFDIFNDTPLLNVLKNYIIKVIVHNSNAQNNIENSNLFKKQEVLEMVMNILRVFVSSYTEFQLSNINYWIDFINRNMTQFPSQLLGVVANVLGFSLTKIQNQESQAANER